MTAGVRANFLPDARFVPLRSALQEHLTKVGEAILPHNFISICDATLLRVLSDTFERIRADEGSIWLLDEPKENLVVAYNSGPNANKIIGFKQPLNKGIISLVVATEQAFVENQVYKNARHSAVLDQKLHNKTYAMIAVPLYFLNQIRGVISCVQLVNLTNRNGELLPDGETPPGFRAQHLGVIQTTTQVLRDLIDYRLLGTAVGWNRQ
jgi:hypothetical protein